MIAVYRRAVRFSAVPVPAAVPDDMQQWRLPPLPSSVRRRSLECACPSQSVRRLAAPGPVKSCHSGWWPIISRSQLHRTIYRRVLPASQPDRCIAAAVCFRMRMSNRALKIITGRSPVHDAVATPHLSMMVRRREPAR